MGLLSHLSKFLLHWNEIFVSEEKRKKGNITLEI